MVWAGLRQRAITGGAAALVVIFLCVFATFVPEARWLLVITAFFAVGIAAWEFASISAENPFHRGIAALACLLPAIGVLLVSASLTQSDLAVLPPLVYAIGALLGGLALAFGLLVALMVVTSRESLQAAEQIAREYMIGILLLGLGGGALVSLGTFEDAGRLYGYLIAVVAANDIVAYFVGSRFQGPRLAPTVSPKKTLSGSIGGLVGGSLVGVALVGILPGVVSWESAAFISLSLVLLAQLGDLSKSYIKRLHDVKDSGSFFPGHGGMLDRIDGLLLSAPLFVGWGVILFRG